MRKKEGREGDGEGGREFLEAIRIIKLDRSRSRMKERKNRERERRPSKAFEGRRSYCACRQDW